MRWAGLGSFFIGGAVWAYLMEDIVWFFLGIFLSWMILYFVSWPFLAWRERKEREKANTLFHERFVAEYMNKQT